MAGFGRVFLLVPVALPLLFAACASGSRPNQPAIDPVQEKITILQKQLLELQKHQNETRRTVESQSSRTNEIDARVTSLEAQRAAPPTAPAVSAQKPSPAAASTTVTPKRPVAKQPPKKKKKPARRVEP